MELDIEASSLAAVKPGEPLEFFLARLIQIDSFVALKFVLQIQSYLKDESSPSSAEIYVVHVLNINVNKLKIR